MTDPASIVRVVAGLLALALAARAGGWVFGRLTLPRVVGEICGGLLLGPTVLGAVLPDAKDWLFGAPGAGKALTAVSWLGLVLLLFVSGFEMKGGFSRDDRRIVGIVLAGATIVPFAAGVAAAAVFDFSPFQGERGNSTSLVIVIGIAVAVTSIPVISRIFLDLGILDTRFARLVLAIAGVEDVALWVALAVATGLAGAAAPTALELVATPAVTVAFCAAGLLLLPRSLRAVAAGRRAGPLVRRAPLPAIAVLAVGAGALANAVGVNVIFGAFLAGIAVGTLPGPEVGAARVRLKSAAVALLTPMYFGAVGLKLDLLHRFDPLFFLGFFVFCTVVKTAATLVAGQLALRDWRSTANLAVALNARGGPGIVLATVAYGLQIIDERFFVTLVLTAIVTSLMAGWWFRLVVARGWYLLRVGAPGPARHRVPAGTEVGVSPTY